MLLSGRDALRPYLDVMLRITRDSCGVLVELSCNSYQVVGLSIRSGKSILPSDLCDLLPRVPHLHSIGNG